MDTSLNTTIVAGNYYSSGNMPGDCNLESGRKHGMPVHQGNEASATLYQILYPFKA